MNKHEIEKKEEADRRALLQKLTLKRFNRESNYTSFARNDSSFLDPRFATRHNSQSSFNASIAEDGPNDPYKSNANNGMLNPNLSQASI